MGRIFKTTKYSDYLGEERPLLDIYVQFIPDTPTPTPSVTPTMTPTISLTPSVTPTISLTPTNTVTMTPTNNPTASVTPTPTATPSYECSLFEFKVTGAIGNTKYEYVSCAGVTSIWNNSKTFTQVRCARTSPAPFFRTCNFNQTCSITNLNTPCS